MDVTVCYYCGEPSYTLDHVVPRWIIAAVRDSGETALYDAIFERNRRLTVPACQECNSFAGGKYHATLDERAAFVRARLARKYQRVLALPDWSAHEFEDMAPTLQNYVLAGIVKRDEVRRRLRYRGRGVIATDAAWWSIDARLEALVAADHARSKKDDAA